MVIQMRLLVLFFFVASVGAEQLPEPGLALPAIVPPMPVIEQPKVIHEPIATYYQSAPVTTYHYPPTITYYQSAPVTTYYYPRPTGYIPPRLNYYPIPMVYPIRIRR